MSYLVKHFYYEYYRDKYEELKDYSFIKAKSHFINIGSKKFYKFNKLLENFDYEYYILKNKEFAEYKYIKACNNFIDNYILDTNESKESNESNKEAIKKLYNSSESLETKS